ncbi:hypothetical protein IWZ00DRAFT_73608 [Phyllosticta capitalensis]
MYSDVELPARRKTRCCKRARFLFRIMLPGQGCGCGRGGWCRLGCGRLVNLRPSRIQRLLAHHHNHQHLLSSQANSICFSVATPSFLHSLVRGFSRTIPTRSTRRHTPAAKKAARAETRSCLPSAPLSPVPFPLNKTTTVGQLSSRPPTTTSLHPRQPIAVFLPSRVMV